MKTAIVLLIVVLMNLGVSAQKKQADNSATVTKGRTNFTELSYGSRTTIQNFYDQLNAPTFIKLGRPLQIITIGACENIHFWTRYSLYANLAYSQVIPQTIYLWDTLKGKITGGVLNLSFGKFIVQSKSFDLSYYIGFNTGRLRMFDNEPIHQKNGFFSPKVGIRPRVKFGRFSIVGSVEYEYDLSKSNWNRTRFSTGNKVRINNLKQSGMTVQLGVGYTLS